jgi:hypothetical protein
MHIVRELEDLIRRSRALLALEVEHLRRVQSAGLDATDAQWTVDRRCRYIERLELQHDRVLAHRIAIHREEPGGSEAIATPIEDSHV